MLSVALSTKGGGIAGVELANSEIRYQAMKVAGPDDKPIIDCRNRKR